MRALHRNPPPACAARASARARARVLAVALALPAALAACSWNDPDRSGILSPYRTDVPQGNYVTREMLDRVTPGMPREQVRNLLGPPLLNPMFRTDRWDYVFYLTHASGRVDKRDVTIRFEGDRVAAVQAGELPGRDDASDPALPGYRPRRTTAGVVPPKPSAVGPDPLDDLYAR
jgi:outer membrane protein assembly factor BamE